MTSFYSGKKVFVAGGAGLCGQAIIPKLVALGAEVTATEWAHRKIAAAYRDKLLTIYRHDLHDNRTWQNLVILRKNIYEGQDIVFWCAAQVGGAKAIRENPSEMIHYNLEMSSRNIRAAAQAGVKRFCYISSSYVYPDLPYPAKETDIDSGDVPYIHYGLGWIKRYMETLLRHYHMTTQMKAAIIRPTAIFGPHDDFNLETCHVVPALIRKFVEGPYPVQLWGNGSEVRQFTFVDDLADAMLAVTENYAVCDPLNVASDKDRCVSDLAMVIHDSVFGLQEMVARSKSIKDHYRFTGEGPTAVQSRLVDTSKAKRLRGIECKTSLRKGIEKTVEWYKGQV